MKTICIVFLVLSFPAYSKIPIGAYGAGAIYCDSFEPLGEEQKKDIYIWLQGFESTLIIYDMVDKRTHKFFTVDDVNSYEFFKMAMKSYCKINPKDSMAMASIRILNQLKINNRKSVK